MSAPTQEAGPEIDAEIASTVMGWTWDESRCRSCGWPIFDHADLGCTVDNCSMRPAPLLRADRVRPFSSDISAAFSVVEKMRERFGLSFVIGGNGCAKQQSGVKFYRGAHGLGHSIFDAEPHDGWYAVDESIPLAICRAALDAANALSTPAVEERRDA